MRFEVLLVAGVCSLAVSARASAQPTAAQAEVLFNEGLAQMDAGKVSEACALFASSQKLAPAVTTLIRLADCRERNGQFATAWGLFVEVERQTRGSSDAALASFHAIALDRVGKLEPRISKLTISVPAGMHVDRLQILRDGEPVDEAIWNRSLPIDGGTYVVSARAPGMSEWSTSVTVAAEGDTKTADIPKLQVLPAVVEPVATAAPTVAKQDAPPPSKVVPLSVGGGAVVALGVALALEISARSTYDKSDPAVTPNPAEQDEYWHSANTKRHVAQGLAVAGLAGAGVAVWLYLRAGNRVNEPTRTSVRLTPVVGTDGVGIALVGVSR